jgi:hypothetical protein
MKVLGLTVSGPTPFDPHEFAGIRAQALGPCPHAFRHSEWRAALWNGACACGPRYPHLRDRGTAEGLGALKDPKRQARCIRYLEWSWENRREAYEPARLALWEARDGDAEAWWARHASDYDVP